MRKPAAAPASPFARRAPRRRPAAAPSAAFRRTGIRSRRTPCRGAAPAPGRSGAGDRGGFGLDIGGAAPAALIPGLGSSGPGAGDSLDSLFGLKPGDGGDPLAQSALANPASKPNMAASHDPLQSLNMAPKASAATVADDFSDLHLPFIAPPLVEARKPPAAPPPAAPSPSVRWPHRLETTAGRSGDVVGRPGQRWRAP